MGVDADRRAGRSTVNDQHVAGPLGQPQAPTARGRGRRRLRPPEVRRGVEAWPVVDDFADYAGITPQAKLAGPAAMPHEHSRVLRPLLSSRDQPHAPPELRAALRTIEHAIDQRLAHARIRPAART